MAEEFTGYEDKPREECGVAGIIYTGDSTATDAAFIAHAGLLELQHRGEEAAGISASDGANVVGIKDTGRIGEVFPSDKTGEARLRGLGAAKLAVAHTRWGTVGLVDGYEAAQPFLYYAQERNSTIAVVTNGETHNDDLMCQVGLLPEGFATDSDFNAHYISEKYNLHGDLTRAVREAVADFTGAFSLLVMNETTMVACRDFHGFRPLVMGELDNGQGIVFASETPALEAMGASYVRDVEPGEVITVEQSGTVTNEFYAPPDPRHCLFEPIYVTRPDAVINGQTAHAIRFKDGETLAERHPVMADIVMSIPDSGRAAASGFAQASGLTYAEGILVKKYRGRSFIQPDQEAQEKSAANKYIFIPEVIRGKSIVVVDDSVVNGTTIRQISKILRELGATEVHLRVASPPIKDPCHYGAAFKDRSRLVATHVTDEPGEFERELAQALTLDSVGFLKPEDNARSVGLELGRFCTACFTGEYPTKVPVTFGQKPEVVESVVIL